MLDLLGIGTNRGHSMIGVGISAGLTGAKRARSIQDPLPALDLDWATDRSLPAAYGPTPSFSRASTGTFFNSSGVLSSAAINAPRFDHTFNDTSWVSRGLLVEEQRTNLCLYSEQFNDSSYAKNNCTVTANSIASPDGLTTADTLAATASTGIHYLEKNGYSVSTIDNTISIFAKYGTHRYLQISANNESSGVFGNFDLVLGAVGSVGASTTSQITNVGSGWYRCSIKYAATNTASRPLVVLVSSSTAARVESNTLTASDYLYLWGCQQETGSFPTSYIPTTTAAVTRSADVCQITGTDLTSILSFTEGSFAVEFDSLVSNTGALGYGIFAISDSATNLSRMFFDFYIPDNEYRWYIRDDGNSGKTTQLKPGPLSGQGVSVKSSMAYKQNDIAISLNSASALTGIDQTIPTTLNRLQIGTNDAYAGRVWCGHIARLRYYPTRLTNAKLQELST